MQDHRGKHGLGHIRSMMIENFHLWPKPRVRRRLGPFSSSNMFVTAFPILYLVIIIYKTLFSIEEHEKRGGKTRVLWHQKKTCRVNFFAKPTIRGLTNYVIRHITIYGNLIHKQNHATMYFGCTVNTFSILVASCIKDWLDIPKFFN
jgi:hypothetical protein